MSDERLFISIQEMSDACEGDGGKELLEGYELLRMERALGVLRCIHLVHFLRRR